MGTVAVVVLDVDAEHLLKVPRPVISNQSRYSARTVGIQQHTASSGRMLDVAEAAITPGRTSSLTRYAG